MPIYDYVCPKCKKKKIDVFKKSWEEEELCEECKAPMEKLVSGFPVPHVFPAEGIFLEHVSPNGKRFYSKKEMQQYAKENDLELGALG